MTKLKEIEKYLTENKDNQDVEEMIKGFIGYYVQKLQAEMQQELFNCLKNHANWRKE